MGPLPGMIMGRLAGATRFILSLDKKTRPVSTWSVQIDALSKTLILITDKRIIVNLNIFVLSQPPVKGTIPQVRNALTIRGHLSSI